MKRKTRILRRKSRAFVRDVIIHTPVVRMTFLLVAYIALVGILVWAMNRWERAMKIPGYGSQ